MTHILCLLLLLFSARPGLHAWPESFPITSRYDRASDTTTSYVELLNDERSPLSVTLHANAAFRGREPNETGRFWFTLSVTQGHVPRKTPSLLETNQSLILSLDDASWEAPLTEHRREYYEMIQRVSESAHVALDRADLPRLLATRQLSGHNGKVKFKLSDAALTALKEFITRQALATQAQ
jgi:hypothetical protein